MSRPRRITYAAAALLIIAAVIASCLINQNFFKSTTPTISSQELSSLTYYTEQYPPYNYVENGTLKGVSVDLLGAVTEKLGAKVGPNRLNLTTWTAGYQAALTQDHAALFSTVRLPSRENSFKWAGPIYTYRYALFAGWDRAISINGTSDLKNYKIGVISDDAAIPLLLSEGVDSSQLVNETDAAKLIEMLAHGDIDLWCYPEEVGRFLTEQETGNYYAFNIVYRLDNVDLYYAFSKNTPDSTVAAFQWALDSLKSEKDTGGFSTYEMILGQYIPAIGFSHLNYLTDEAAPFNYAGTNGDATGISVEILQAIFRNAMVSSSPNVKIVPFADGLEQAQKNSSTVLFSVVRTPERDPQYKWVGPFTKAVFSVYCAADRNITVASAGDLNRYRIGTVNGTIEYNMLTSQGVNESNIVVASTPAQLLSMLHDGEIDLWATAEFVGHYEINRAGYSTRDYKVAYNLGEKDLYFIFSKDVPTLVVDAFQHALETVRSQKDSQGFSEYERIIYRNIGVGYAKQTFSNTQVVALVEQTAAAIKQNATDAFLNINSGRSPYKSNQYKGLYVFAYDTNETMVAHADNILMVGVNFKGKTDVAGAPFRDYILQGAIANGTGWVDYVYSNIAQSNLYYKTTYYQLVTGSDGVQYVICSGNFKN